MKYFSLFLLAVMSILIYSCDGADYENGADNYCYFQPTLSSITGGDEFTPDVCRDAYVTFLFTDDLGNDYSWTHIIGDAVPVMSLPKNRCYGAILIGSSRDVCGYFNYDFMVDNEVCFTASESVDDRIDILPNDPEYTFCLDDECSCPEVM